jgi:hypothetical protein
MDTTTSPTATINCASPGCGIPTTLDQATYVDGCGHICPGCAGPLPAWWDGIEPPY